MTHNKLEYYSVWFKRDRQEKWKQGRSFIRKSNAIKLLKSMDKEGHITALHFYSPNAGKQCFLMGYEILGKEVSK